MSRKLQRARVSHERWLVSYADFITLLFAFFVVLYAFAKADQKKQMSGFGSHRFRVSVTQHRVFLEWKRTKRCEGAGARLRSSGQLEDRVVFAKKSPGRPRTHPARPSTTVGGADCTQHHFD